MFFRHEDIWQNQWTFPLRWFIYDSLPLHPAKYVYIPFCWRDTQMCVTMHQIHVYFMCLTLEREGGLPICRSSVLLFWLVFLFLIYICHADWRQNITAALNLYISYTAHFVIMLLRFHWLFGNLSSVSIWPYFLFSMHKYRLVSVVRLVALASARSFSVNVKLYFCFISFYQNHSKDVF